MWLFILSITRGVQNRERIPSLFFRGMPLPFIIIMIDTPVAAMVNWFRRN
jgi:hypothetical protein